VRKIWVIGDSPALLREREMVPASKSIKPSMRKAAVFFSWATVPDEPKTLIFIDMREPFGLPY
jgi:hypothetical protein